MKKAGFDCMDFPVKEIYSLLPYEKLWKKCIENVLCHCEKEKIHFEICHLPFTMWTKDKNEEELNEFEKNLFRSVDVATMLKVKNAVVHPNTVAVPLDEYSEEKEYEKVIRHLMPIAEYAKKNGVNIAIENMILRASDVKSHRFCQSAEELCRVCDKIEEGICWDFGHANTTYKKQSQPLSYIGGRLRVLHVNDNNAYEDDHTLPFYGTIDWKDAMAALKKAGFKGAINFEIQTARLPGNLREKNAEFMTEIAKTLNDYYEKEE